MKSKLFILAVMLVGTNFAHAQTAKRSPYIGYEYEGIIGKPLRNGVKEVASKDIGEPEGNSVYEIATVEKGRTTMLWLNVYKGNYSTGGWKVLDVLTFPSHLKRSEFIFFYDGPYARCTRLGKDIPNPVFDIGITGKQPGFQPSKLWIADLSIKKFRSVPLSGIKCEDSTPLSSAF